MVQQDVAGPDAVEDLGIHARPVSRQGGQIGAEQQLRLVDVVKNFLQSHQVHRAVDPVAVLRHDIVFAQQAVDDGVRAIGRHFQPHRIAEVPGAQFALQCGAQIGDVVVVDEQFAVAGDAKLMHAEHFESRKQLPGKRLHARRQQHEPVSRVAQLRRQGHDPGQGARGLHHAQLDIAAEGVGAAELHGEHQVLVDDAGEGMRRIEADRREQGRNFGLEIMLRPGALRIGPVGQAVQADALLVECRQHGLLQHAVLVGNQGVGAFGNLGQGFADEHAIRRA